MARYFFHTYDDAVSIDDEGMEVAGLAQVRERAIRELRILASDAIVHVGQLRLRDEIRITDEAGAMIMVVSVADAVAIIS